MSRSDVASGLEHVLDRADIPHELCAERVDQRVLCRRGGHGMDGAERFRFSLAAQEMVSHIPLLVAIH